MRLLESSNVSACLSVEILMRKVQGLFLILVIDQPKAPLRAVFDLIVVHLPVQDKGTVPFEELQHDLAVSFHVFSTIKAHGLGRNAEFANEHTFSADGLFLWQL